MSHKNFGGYISLEEKRGRKLGIVASVLGFERAFSPQTADLEDIDLAHLF